MILSRRFLAAALAVLPLVAFAADPVLKSGDRVAIIGDSITEQKLYSKYMECYLLACSGVPELKVFQFGWSGETAGGFANRVENDLGVFKPTVATTCYGMNDGGYQPWKDQIGQGYEQNMRNAAKKMEAIGVKTIVFGSPGAVDTKFFGARPSFGGGNSADGYNDNLAHLRDIEKKLAEEYKQKFANVHDAMIDTMKKAKAGLGEDYPVCGGDGFHPGPNGQLIMAYAFLKALGCDGDIGTITVDAKGEAKATAGHKVLSAKDGAVEIESARWPFCFEGDMKSANSTRSITPYLPINQDLNRLTLKVTNLAGDKAKVTWGEETKEFTKDQLAAGINLNAEFSKTPFDGQFGKLQNAVGNKQNWETMMIKQWITNFRNLPGEMKEDPKVQAGLASLREGFVNQWTKLEENVRKELVPVKHTLKVE